MKRTYKKLKKFTKCTKIHLMNFFVIEYNMIEPVQFFAQVGNFTANSLKFFTDKSAYNNWQHQGTEELAHLEMVGTLVKQLTDYSSIEEIERAGLGPYYTDHGVGLEYILKEFKIILI